MFKVRSIKLGMKQGSFINLVIGSSPILHKEVNNLNLKIRMGV